MDVRDEPDFSLDVVDDGHPVLVVRGELDFETSGRLRDELARIAQRGGSPVRLDLDAVSFIDSVGLSVLVQAKKRYDAEARVLQIRPVSARVRATVDMAGASTFLGIDGIDG